MAEAEMLFPLSVSLGSRGGPVRRTRVVRLASGREVRNAQWRGSLRRWEAGFGVRCAADVEAVVAFFEACGGRAGTFRWRDPLDHSSGRVGEPPQPTDQRIGTGDGQTTDYHLVKTYGTQARAITRPVDGSVVVAVDGAEVAASADPTTGLVTLAAPPAPGAIVTAGYLFDVPARFDTDELMIGVEPGGGEVPEIPIQEVRA